MKSAIDSLEHHYFLRSYSNELTASRLARLESLVLGHSVNGSENERFQKLKDLISEIGIYPWLEMPGVYPLISSYDTSPEMIFAWDKWHHGYGAAVKKAYDKIVVPPTASSLLCATSLRAARTVTIKKNGEYSAYSSELNDAWNEVDNQQKVRRDFLYAISAASQHLDRKFLTFPVGSKCPEINFDITFTINSPKSGDFNWTRDDVAQVF